MVHLAAADVIPFEIDLPVELWTLLNIGVGGTALGVRVKGLPRI